MSISSEMDKIAIHAITGGAQNALRALLNHWTDDNETNRKMAEALLALAICQGEGI